MKIALVTFSISGKGGTQRQFLSLAQALKRMGHDVTVYSLDREERKSYGDLVKELKVVVPHNIPPDPLNLPAGKEPSHNLVELFFRKLKRKSFLERVSRELAAHVDLDTEVVNAHDGESYKVGYFFKKRNPSAKVIWTMNDPPISYLPKNNFVVDTLRRLFNFFELWYERKFVRSLSWIVVLDERNQKMAESFYHRPAVIIRSGVDFRKFYQPVKKRDLKNQPVQILAVGILAPHRRFEDVISAADILRRAGRSICVTIVSQGKRTDPLAVKLNSMVDSFGLENIVDFRLSETGGVSDAELFRVYNSSDIFIFPNHMQTWGLAVFEAMAAGLPAVVSRTSGASEVLRDGESALLVDPKSPDQIATKVELLIDNPRTYTVIATRGQEFVKRNISWDKYAEQVFQVYTNHVMPRS